MMIRPRAAAIILNEQKELLVLLQKNPHTGVTWWTLPGGGMEPAECATDTIIREVEEECLVKCQPSKLVYVSEYVDYSIDTHHLGMFFLADLEQGASIGVGIDPEVSEQYIIDCQFISEKVMKESDIPIYPPFFKNLFWDDLRNGFKNYQVYHNTNECDRITTQ